MSTTLSHKVWRPVNIKKVQTERAQIFAIRRCDDAVTVIRALAWRRLDIQLVEKPMGGGQSEVDSETKGIRLVYRKKGM